MLPGPGWNHMRNPSLSWNAPSASQQHYQPELSSTTRRSKSMRAVLEFKDKASIDWCAEAQALNPFDKRPCLFEKSKAPRNVSRFSLLPCEGANISSLATFPSITTTLLMYEIVPCTVAVVQAQLSGSQGEKTKAMEFRSLRYRVGEADSISSVTQEGLVCPTETKTLLH